MVKRDYQRGIFASTETVVIELFGDLFRAMGQQPPTLSAFSVIKMAARFFAPRLRIWMWFWFRYISRPQMHNPDKVDAYLRKWWGQAAR